MIVERVDWDSNFFNYEVGKINLKDEKLIDFSEFFYLTKNYKLIYLFSKKKNDSDFLLLADEKIILERNLNFSIVDKNIENIIIQPFDINKHKTYEIQKLALESGIYSRFYLDPNFIKNEYERLYLSWINQSLQGILAFEVLVALNEKNTILGFITIKKINDDIADIGLLAVSKESRGIGIASNLLKKAIIKANDLGYKKIQVVTQNENLPAMRLYESEGFKTKEKTFVYHYWNL